MPGFRSRAPGLGAGGVFRLDLEQSMAPFNTATIQADANGHCSHSLQMPGRSVDASDETASAAWRIEATPVSIGADEATVDVRWSRRVPRPGVLFEQSVERTERLTLRDGARGILDVVRSTGKDPRACETFAIAVELRFASSLDEDTAGLGFDLWLVDRSEPGATPRRVRTHGRQGADVVYGFPPIAFAGADGPVTLSMSGVVTGRARRDGFIDLTFDAQQTVHDDRGSRGGSGRKRLAVRPGETIEFELPDAERVRLPPELADHDFVMRVTTERLW
jgi:hypothetical protein